MNKHILDQQYATKKGWNYYRHYKELFASLADKPVTLFEMGIQRGGSLELWRDFFPQGTIVGLDKMPVTFDDSSGRIHLYQGLQQDTALLQKIGEEMAPDGFDIIIDDCSHIGEHLRTSFWFLFDHFLKKDGLYIIEDWATGYWESWPDGDQFQPNHTAGTVGFIKELVDECGARAITDPERGTPPLRNSRISSFQILGGMVIVKKASY